MHRLFLLMRDESFHVNLDELVSAERALSPEHKPDFSQNVKTVPHDLPTQGVGEQRAMRVLSSLLLGGSQHLDDPFSFAHMDPPTPWITWAATLWNARLNQNLLHPATAPVARELEAFGRQLAYSLLRNGRRTHGARISRRKPHGNLGSS